jgi:putative acetyltransferase
MSEIRIRSYEPSDIDDLITLFRDTVRRIARRDYTQDQVTAWAPDTIDLEARAVRHSSKPTWIAEISGTMVGFGDLEPDGHLDCMYVHADYQGRGIASRLLAEIEAAAKAQGLTRLYSEVSITARPFFERRGFRVIAPQIVRARGQEFLNYRMEKFLAGA